MHACIYHISRAYECTPYDVCVCANGHAQRCQEAKWRSNGHIACLEVLKEAGWLDWRPNHHQKAMDWGLVSQI